MNLCIRVVLCVLCGCQWLASDPRVLYRSCDGRWWCTDEAECKARHTANVAAIQRALDASWASLEADGWRWP